MFQPFHAPARHLAAVIVIAMGLGSPLCEGQSVQVRSGTKLLLNLETPVNTATAREGDIVFFRVRSAVRVADQIAIPAGTRVKATVTVVKSGVVNGKKQRAEIRIRLDEFALVNQGSLPLRADVLKVKEEERQATLPNVAQNALGGMFPGMALGGLLGGSRKGAGIGTAVSVGIGIWQSLKSPKPQGADIDLQEGSIFQTELKQQLAVSDTAAFDTAAKPASLPSAPPTSPSAGTSISSPVSPPDLATAPDPNVPRLSELQPVDVPAPASVTASEKAGSSSNGPEGAFTIAVNVKLVLVDAMVRDRAGQPMSNLRQEDFRLFEDGKEQHIQSFSRDELPLAVALVIDRSGSVAPLMNQIQSAAFQALGQLKRGDQVALFSFAATVEQLEELTTDRQRVANRIGNIQAGGGTAIVDAVDEALRYLDRAAPDKRRAVVLVSDNLEGRSHTSTARAIQFALESQAAVYSVKISQSRSFLLGVPGIPSPGLPPGNLPSDPVSLITKETGGEVFEAVHSDLDAVLATTVERLKLRYTLGYDPVRTSSGTYHRIEARLVDRFGKPGSEYTIHSRSGYYDRKQ
jgi:VWFA-related protein